MTTSPNELYSNYQWGIIESLSDALAEDHTDETGYRTLKEVSIFDPDSGPTLTAEGGGGDFEANDAEHVFAQGTKKTTTYHRTKVKSDGLLTLDSDTTTVDMADLTTYSNYRPKANVHSTDWRVYSGVDASNATDYVTYNGLDNSNWYHQWGTNGGSGTLSNPYITSSNRYVEYDVANKFKGGDYGNLVYGGHGNDVLIGGASDDEIHGVGGNNKIYGVGGDNKLYGGNGDDWIFGGTGNDFINTGAGNNTVILANGDNWVVAPQNAIVNGETVTYSNDLVAGSGTDTFVIGNIPASETITTSDLAAYNSDLFSGAGLSMGESVIGVGIEALKTTPLIGVMADTLFSVVETLVGGTPSETVETVDWPTYDSSYIYNFNPLTDRILMPTNGDHSNIHITATTSGTDDYALEFEDKATGDTFLSVNFASATDIFGDWYTDDNGNSTALSDVEIAGFAQAFLANAFTMDASQVSYNSFNNSSASVSSLGLDNDLAGLGTGGYAFGGAWSGNFLNGNIDGDYYMGTAHDDVLFGYSITSGDIESKTSGGLIFYGFSGDNLFGTGTGYNTVYGGDGNDTITYQYGEMAVYADMSDKTTHPRNSTGHGDFYQIYQGSPNSEGNIDTVYNVQNIVGSRFDDVLVGDDLDNTFYSTGGANTWTGTGGANTFVLNGGSVEITDYSQSDTIMLYKSEYTKSANLAWYEEDDAWMLRDVQNLDVDIVTLDKTGDFEMPGEVTMHRDNGTNATVTLDIHYSELLAA